jgi:hypothetical protein
MNIGPCVCASLNGFIQLFFNATGNIYILDDHHRIWLNRSSQFLNCPSFHIRYHYLLSSDVPDNWLANNFVFSKWYGFRWSYQDTVAVSSLTRMTVTVNLLKFISSFLPYFYPSSLLISRFACYFRSTRSPSTCKDGLVHITYQLTEKTDNFVGKFFRHILGLALHGYCYIFMTVLVEGESDIFAYK